MAWIEVTEPLRVEVMRSCSWPISDSSVGWYPTCDGMRPRSAETSEPACTKRKMLSMKRSTSWPSSSRKYSAIVSPERAPRARGAARPRLRRAEDSVEEEEHALALLVTEVLRHRQPGERDAHARAGRL